MTKRRRGRTGQSHSASPKSRLYKTPPASEVVVKNLDGEVVRVEPARDPEAEPWKKPKRRGRGHR